MGVREERRSEAGEDGSDGKERMRGLVIWKEERKCGKAVKERERQKSTNIERKEGKAMRQNGG